MLPAHAELSAAPSVDELNPTGAYRFESSTTGAPIGGPMLPEECLTELDLQISFSISENPGQVLICFNNFLDGGATSDINGNSIDNFSFSDNTFTDLVASESEITGVMTFPFKISVDNVISDVMCSIDITAPLVDDVISCEIGETPP